jgi:hypothetical protein
MSRAYDELVKCFEERPADESSLETLDHLYEVVRRHGGHVLMTPEEERWPKVGRVLVRARVAGGAVFTDRDGRVWIRADPMGD